MKNFLIRTATALLIIYSIHSAAFAADLLIPGGQVIGLQLHDDTVTVAAFDENSCAKAAGIRQGDRILRINEKEVRCADDVRTALEHADGQVDVSVLRGNTAKTVTVAPQRTACGPRLGVYLRQGMTGLGTVTYYDPDTGSIGTLGHGVNAQSGQLLRITDGSLYQAHIYSVKKGKAGSPGQLLGSLSAAAPIGSVEKNTSQGVFGKTQPITGQPLPTADAGQVHTGGAVIRSTVNGSSLREYSVEILKIYPNGSDRTRNMLLKVTDPALLEATGGIVQGMSGSPLLQDGRIVGAVTHVLVNDPTMGYAIFIENMLEAAG